MKDIISIILELEQSNSNIYLENGKLKIDSPDGVVLDAVIPRIKIHRDKLIEYLSAHNSKINEMIPVGGTAQNYPLSSSQRRLWILSQMEQGSVAYNIPGVYLFSGELDIAALGRSFDDLLQRHEILRTVFRQQEDGEARQWIREPEDIGFRISYHDLRGETKQTVRELVQQEFVKPFDLSAGPLLRASLYQVADDKWVFGYVMHHIISDGWSMEILVKELLQFYNAQVKGEVNPLSPLRIQYRDYAAWQQEQLDAAALEKHKRYWVKQFEGELPVLELATDRPRPAIKTYNGAAIDKALGTEACKKIRALNREQGSTLFMGLLAATNILLYKYTGQEDIIIGSPIAGREQNDLQSQIGFYVNTLALRTRFNSSNSYEELLENIKQVTLGAYEHQVYPFDELVEQLHLHRDVSRNPLFDIQVIVRNAAMDRNDDKGIQGLLQIAPYEPVKNVTSVFDMIFNFTEVGEGLHLNIIYNTDIYTAETVEGLADHFDQLLEAITAAPGKPISQLALLSDREKEYLVTELNDTQAGYPDKTLVELFEQQVLATPGNTAVVHEQARLTYTELNERSNQLGRYIRNNYGVQPGDLVAIKLDRSEWMIISILAVLKSGGAYVPVDPSYPQERIGYMITDSRCKVVIDEMELGRFRQEADRYEKSNPEGVNKPGDLAYVIYTSGTTGHPKGSLVEHNNVVRLMKNDRFQFDFGSSDVWTMFHSYCFDFSVWEMYGALLYGGKLVVIPSATAKDPAACLEVLSSEKVTVLNQTPSAFYNLIKEEQQQENADLPLRYVIFGGEALSPGKLAGWKQRYPSAKLVNMYGITETTVHVTYKEITGKEIVTNSSSIGRPIPTLSCYVLDKDRQLLPPGVPGELYVGGEGVARGYLNRAELTAEKFLSSPFRKGERLYRSGDKVRLLANGEMEYMGRIDEQVKIRGHRVELGEIENALQSYKDIDTVVVARMNTAGENELIAYVVSKEELHTTGIRSHLDKILPGYMIPDHFVQIEYFPLNANGKVDKKALPEPGLLGMGSGAAYIAPGSGTEKKLAAIWQEILGREKISVNDSFFELGGNSLKIIRLVSLINKEFAVAIELKSLFTVVVLEEQARLIEQAGKKNFIAISPVEVQPDYVLSSSQRRLWVLSQIEEGNIGYNIPGAYVFEGMLDRIAFSKAFDALIERHEILRTIFRENEQGKTRQFIQLPGETGFVITYYDVRQEKKQEGVLRKMIQKEFTRPFNLAKGPMIRAVLYQVSDQRWIFSYVMHHIISDGTSMEILVRELLLLYNAFVSAKENPLTPLHIQYKDYAAWQQRQLSGEMLQEHKEYWMEQFKGELPVLEFPADELRPAIKTYNGAVVNKSFGQEKGKRIRAISQENGATLFMGLLAAVNALLYKQTSQEDIIIGTPMAAREHADLDNQIGFYINTLALRTRFDAGRSYLELLEQVKQVTIGAYTHQVYPFDELVDGLKLQRDMSRNVLFDVMVDLQQQGNAMTEDALPLSGLKAENYSAVTRMITKFDLTFSFIEKEEELEINIEYNSDIYKRKTIQRLADHLSNLLGAIIDDPATPVSQLDYLGEEEKYQLITGFNDATFDFPKEKTIVDLFEEQVNKTPDHIAIVFEGKTFTYSEINEASNQLAWYLRKKYNIKPDDPVAIKLQRNEWMIIAILGVLKAGGAYVPVDPAYPQDRIAYMLEDSQCKSVIDWQELSVFIKEKDKYDKNNLELMNTPEDLVYIIYTSGTTGNPKGVMIEHRNLVARIIYLTQQYDLSEKDNLLFYRSYSFDAAIEEYLLPLLIGAKCCIAPVDFNLNIVNNIINFIPLHQVSKINMPPVLLGELIRSASDSDLEKLSCLRHMVSGGDKLTMDLVNEFLSRFTATLHNAYGPTENTDDSTNWKAEMRSGRTNVPIGRPVPGSLAYVLNNELNVVPVGVVGEIHVGGPGLARGYLNKPGLTAEKFIPNPFKKDERIYKTGDLGRWLPDGTIEFIGRKDNQVKIRGHRIELGEIENVLSSYPGIESVVVTASAIKGGEKELIAYIVSKNDLHINDIRLHLGKLLPIFMLPAHFVQLQAMPLNSNGKIDRKALPEPQGMTVSTGVKYMAPRNETEQHLVEVCEEVLKKRPISIQDDFFILGGDSIKSIQVAARLRKRGYSLAIQDILLSPILEKMALKIKADTRSSKQEMVTGLIPLSPIQQMFFERHPVNNRHYNQSVLLYSKKAIIAEALQSALDKIVLHHDALRMVYHHHPSGWSQENKGPLQGYSFEAIEVTDKSSFDQHCNRIQESFDLENGPLFKAALFRASDGDRLLLAAHHLVIDGVSWRILFEDLSILYQQHLSREELSLPSKTDSFSYWQQKQSEYAISAALQKEKEYWSGINSFPAQSLPPDHPEGTNLIKDTVSGSFVFDQALTTRLLTQCYQTYHTGINDILLTALGLAIEETFNLQYIAINLEGHGRENIDADTDITRTVGWFTTVFPVVLDMSYKEDTVRQLIAVKENLHRVPNKGIGYGLLRYQDQNSFASEPGISFNYLGDFGSGIDTEQGEQLFEFSGDYRGKEISETMEREAILAISGMVVEGRMRLSIAYSSQQYAASTIDRLTASYQQQLKKLVELLSAEKKAQLTPVDLTYKGLTVEQLEKLNQTL